MRADTRRDSVFESPVASRQGGLVATAGAFGALLASSCCVAPLLFVSLGISGAWIGNLTALAPYKPYLLTATGLLLAAGFRHVYFRRGQVCNTGISCANSTSRSITKIVLWTATILALMAATVSFWAPLFY